MEAEYKSDDIASYNIDSEIAINLFNRYWDIFKNLDNKRIKSFLQLLLFLSLILLFKLNPDKEFTIPFVDYKVDFNIAILIAPLIISVFFFRFVLLSVLALNAQAKHNRYFLYFRKTLSKKYSSKPVMVDAFRDYELSEIPNLFLFPLPFDKSNSFVHSFKKKTLSKIAIEIRRIVQFIVNVFFVVLTLLPLLFNFYIIFFEFQTMNATTYYLYNFFWIYLPLTFIIILSIIYFYLFKTIESRQELKNDNTQTPL